MMLKTIILSLLMCLGVSAQCHIDYTFPSLFIVPSTGVAIWDPRPDENVIYGVAGTGANTIHVAIAGSSGVFYVDAPNVQLHGFIDLDGPVRWQGVPVSVGAPDSGGKGYRVLRIPN